MPTNGGDLRVSVIVPVYNGGRTIAACIESLLAQDLPSIQYEIIVVDNNSTDDTCDIVRRYPVKLLHERALQTSYAARNLGIREASGSIVAFTDADCVADPRWLINLLEPFSRPCVGGVGGRILDGKVSDSVVERFLVDLSPLANNVRFEGKFLPLLLTCNAAYRKGLLEQVGCFRANLYTIADIDISWRVQLETGAEIVYAPDATITHLHRHTVKGMFRQQRRGGTGQVLLTWLYGHELGYPYPREEQFVIMFRQCKSIAIYCLAAAKRAIACATGNRELDYLVRPYLMMVAEIGGLLGRIDGLIFTRFFSRSPVGAIFTDPLER